MHQSDDGITKWGIMGTGTIAQKFTRDLAFVDHAKAVAVGSRSYESALQFAKTHRIAQAYGSYEELVHDPDIDAIYVATPHPFHKQNVLLSLEAGKAVLCEKPMTVNASELKEMMAFAHSRKLFLMEAMWTRFLPAIVKVREWIHEGKIGDVRQVEADFGFCVPYDPQGRLFDPALGGGALLDAGIYPVSFASMILGPHPTKVLSTAHMGDTGVDDEFSAILEYESGQTATLHGAVRLNLQNGAYVFGTKGFIHIPDHFFSANQATLYVDEVATETFLDERESMGYNFEAQEVGRCLEKGVTESAVMSLQESLGIMQLLDQIRGQWGLRYPFE